MNEVDRMMDRIHDSYAKFREDRYDLPKYLVLSLEARQAIKVYLSQPHKPPSSIELKTYLGITIIPLEDAVIIE